DVHGGGGGHVGFAARLAVVDFDGADDATFAAGLGEDVAEEVGGGGLAVGAGDAQDLHFMAGVIEGEVGEDGGGGGGIRDENLGERARGDAMLGDDGDGAAGGGVGGVAGAIRLGARAGDE